MAEMVADWDHKAHPDRTVLQHAKKLLEEASECHVAAKEVMAGRNDCINVLREVADIALLCFVIANSLSANLDEFMIEKLAVLEARVKEQAQRDKERGID